MDSKKLDEIKKVLEDIKKVIIVGFITTGLMIQWLLSGFSLLFGIALGTCLFYLVYKLNN